MVGQEGTPNNKKIARNALMLTLRMILVTIVGFYTSRVVFSQLGDVNYGIYGVVGGILGFMSFLTAAMAGASSRFITFEVGRGDETKINEIFNSSFWIHVGIAIIVIIVGETVGLWLLNNVLVIPEPRMNAAFWVFQFSILSSAVSITQVPYSAVLMAYEKMDIYAYMEIINVVMKLLVVYLLSIAPYDKLVVYAFLLLVVSVLIAFTYRIYCIRKFSVCRIHRLRDYRTTKAMLSFSGLDLYGNIGVTVNSQGLVYAINIFFGVVYNAAATLANTINGMILALTTNIAIAFKPQIIKQYSQGNIENMETVMCNSAKFTLIAIALIAVPCFFEAELIMKFWLGEVPPYSVEFMRIIIVQSFFPIINNLCNAAIHATGIIKGLTFINGTIFMIMPIIVFLAYHFGSDVLWGYGIEIIGMIIIILIAINLIRRLIPQFNAKRFIKTLLLIFTVIVIPVAAVFFIHELDISELVRAIAETLTYSICLVALSWFFILTKDNKKLIKQRLKTII